MTRMEDMLDRYKSGGEIYDLLHLQYYTALMKVAKKFVHDENVCTAIVSKALHDLPNHKESIQTIDDITEHLLFTVFKNSLDIVPKDLIKAARI